MTPAYAATPGGLLLVLAVMLPAAAALVMLVIGPRHTRVVALIALALGLVVALATGLQLVRSDAALIYVLGNWQPPLGIALRADGLSVMMLAVTAVVMAATGLFARELFGLDLATADGRLATSFWILLMGLWSGLNLVFVSQDLFNL